MDVETIDPIEVGNEMKVIDSNNRVNKNLLSLYLES